MRVVLPYLAGLGLAACTSAPSNPDAPGPTGPSISIRDSLAPPDDLQLAFGEVTIGASVVQALTVTNAGTADLVIGTIGSLDPLAVPFTFDTDGCSGTALSPGASCTVAVRLGPTSAGALSDSFNIPSNDPISPSVTVDVNGTGVLAPVAVIIVSDSVIPADDHQVVFGNLEINMTADQAVTVTNGGSQNLVLGSVASIDPLAAPFSITTDGCSGIALVPAASCIVGVRFAPTSAVSATDSFDIPSNDSATPSVTVALGGTGALPPTPVIGITDSVMPATDHQIAFGAVGQATTATQTVTVTNVGTAALVLGTIGNANPLATPFSFTANTCSGMTLAPNAACSLTVQFAPTTYGIFSDTFDISSNDPNAPMVTFAVGGTGTAPGITITDSVAPTTDLQLPFGNVAVGSTLTRGVTVTNSGNLNLVIGTIAGLNPLGAPFTFTTDTCSGMTLAPGTNCTLGLQFAPTAATAASDTFDIPSNDPETPSVTFSVSGNGTAPDIAITDTLLPATDLALPFGVVAQLESVTQRITVRNAGSANLVIGTVASANPISAPFSITSNTCSGATLGPAGTCQIAVRFGPTTTGPFADTFDIPSNDPDTGTATISLSGAGATSITPLAPIAKTGQTTCWAANGTVIACAGTGQDGELQRGVTWPAPRFVAGTGAESACITDTLTGLMWPKDADLAGDPDGTWQQALSFVASLNTGAGVCGHTDWRLPNKNELRTLANYGVPANVTWLQSQGFTNLDNVYWSSTSLVAGDDRAWLVNLNSGYLFIIQKSDPGSVWPVRGDSTSAPAPVIATGQTSCYTATGSVIPCAGTGQDGELQRGVAWPTSRFSRRADSSITDNLTGLSWAPGSDTPTITGMTTCAGGSRSWTSALAYVACLNANTYLGHSDWRLANVNELQSLAGVVLQAEGWTGFGGLYWASDSYYPLPDTAWVMGTIGMPATFKSSSYDALVVRGGP